MFSQGTPPYKIKSHVSSSSKKSSSSKRFISSEALSLPCEEQALNTLADIGTPQEWHEIHFSKGMVSGVRVFKSLVAGREGSYLRLSFSRDKIRIDRVSDKLSTSYSYDATRGCVGTVDSTVSQGKESSLSEQYSDFDLKKIMNVSRSQKEKNYLFYVWSPSMNLSIVGVNELRRACQQFGYELIVVADPMASAKDIRKILYSQNWPASYGKQLTSEELKSYNFLVHFPALLILKDGAIQGEVRPGYDEPERLKNFLKQIR
ncbi:MAG: hypothetical protein AAGB31_02965 [Bdellovibrio sp.]